ncbi:MAG TPA: hypothetical protein VIW29_19125 [Polyangiaceae bacterium]
MSALVLLLWLGAPRSAAAAEVRWLGSSDCRRQLEVREQIEAMTKRSLVDVDTADFELEPERTQSGAFQLGLVTISRPDGARSRRVLEGESCVDVTDAAAVAIALAIGTPPPEPEPPPSETGGSAALPPPASSPASSDSPTAAAAKRAKPRASWLVGAGVTLDSAVTPKPAFGGSLRVTFALSPLRLELEAGAFAPSEQLDSSGRGGSFQLFYAAPLVCAQRVFGAPMVMVCFGYELGQLSAEGIGVAQPHERSTFWHALRPELGLAWPMGGGLALSARAGAAIPLSRHEFVLDEPEVVHRPARLSFRAVVGLELAL